MTKVENARTPYIVFKFDDLYYDGWKDWKPITDMILSKGVKADIGIFANSLNIGDEDYLNYVKSLAYDPEHFEIWLHGYYGRGPEGPGKEFLETDYPTQLERFYLSRTTFLKKVDYILRDYGDHWYGGNQNTVKIVNEDPFIKGWVYYENRNPKKVFGVNRDKQVMPRLDVYMEIDTGVVSYEHFLDDWKRYDADTLPYVVIQGHPWGYITDALKSEFSKVVDFLRGKGLTFTHFNDYYRMTNGYSGDTVPPSVPTRLTVKKLDHSQVELSWDASADQGRGIDCYKIYRDGVCIDLSAGTSYTDTVEGSHTYRVAAVNKNNLVSPKCSAVISD